MSPIVRAFHSTYALKTFSKEGGTFITGREAWTGLLGVDGAPGEPTSPHISRDRLRDLTRYGGTILRGVTHGIGKSKVKVVAIHPLRAFQGRGLMYWH